MKSMTAFAQKHFVFDDFTLEISVKSLNHKYLDFSVKGREIPPLFEKTIRDIFKERLVRGKLEITLEVIQGGSRQCDIFLNEEGLKTTAERIASLAEQIRPPVTFSLDPLLKNPLMFHVHDPVETLWKEDESRKELVIRSLREVLDLLIRAREAEGAQLAGVIEASLLNIEKELGEIRERLDDVEALIFGKQVQKMERLLKGTELDPNRLAQEAAVIAEKCCIAEELDRIQIHTRKLRSIMVSPGNHARGKEMDFLTQEVLRETHTIGAKTPVMEVHDRVLSIRREIEKIRQQVQNVE